MFNTGDLGRMLPDGSLEHFGRVDEQVKVKVGTSPLRLYWYYGDS